MQAIICGYFPQISGRTTIFQSGLTGGTGSGGGTSIVGGAKYDQVLRDFYTGVTLKNARGTQPHRRAETGDAMADNAPLRGWWAGPQPSN